MMHNKADVSIPFEQGVELFTALRWLGKRVWLHYLKGALPPKWMTEGVLARMKVVETGLLSDPSGRKP